jgi:hypothetical protein
VANGFRNGLANGQVCTRKHCDEFFPSETPGQVILAQALTQHVCQKPQHLIPDPMPKIVVELLEVIDIHYQKTEGLARLHRGDLRGAEESLDGPAIRKVG